MEVGGVGEEGDDIAHFMRTAAMTYVRFALVAIVALFAVVTEAAAIM